ncbi:glycosyltransferase family 4 protein [Peribacillus loiseleuriae]|uniref:glycosyltransferase family 4 protein n=1 Tax=Peribacillus loiseleuriae TaxID=1679170 RepID=UPI003D0882D7
MKILFVTTVISTINAFLIPHIKLLVEQGNKVDIACNVNKEVNKELMDLGCEIHNIRFERSPLNKANYLGYKKLKKLVLSKEYDLVHTHTPVASLLTRLACKNIKNVKVLYTAHGFHFFKGAALQNWLIYYPIEKIAEKWTDGLITINQEDYNSANKLNLRKRNSVYKVHGIGIDLDKFSPPSIEKKNKLRKEYGYNNDEFILFYAAELNRNKNQNLLIEVVNVLNKRGINVKLLLAGEGILLEKYKMQVSNLGLNENIQFLGHRKDISNLIKISDVAVASSKREGLPVNVMEAMATGLPLVVTDCRGHRDLVGNGENGYVVGTTDVNGFADSIEKLYQSRDLRIEFGETNIQKIGAYSLENVLEELKDVYVIYIN